MRAIKPLQAATGSVAKESLARWDLVPADKMQLALTHWEGVRRVATRPRSRVRGPVGAFVMNLLRPGWEARNARFPVADEGCSVDLLRASPAWVGKLVQLRANSLLLMSVMQFGGMPVAPCIQRI